MCIIELYLKHIIITHMACIFLSHCLSWFMLGTRTGSWWKFATHASSEASARQRISQRSFIPSLSVAPASNNERRISRTCALLADATTLCSGVIPCEPTIIFGSALADNIQMYEFLYPSMNEFLYSSISQFWFVRQLWLTIFKCTIWRFTFHQLGLINIQM